jgi:antitoxin (DNA-binding transcriptional repressor) of toxin-antitoxin stability system
MVVVSGAELAIMTAIPLDQAQARLPELVHGLAPGDHVVITENNLPVAQLVNAATPLKQRKLGSMRGTVTYMAPDFDAPLEEFREYSE